MAVEALKRLPSNDVGEYVFPSRATARWPSPKKPYRWDLGKEFRALVRSLGLEDLRLHDAPVPGAAGEPPPARLFAPGST